MNGGVRVTRRAGGPFLALDGGLRDWAIRPGTRRDTLVRDMTARRLLVAAALLMGLTALGAGLSAPSRRLRSDGVTLAPAVTAAPVVVRTLDAAHPRTVAVHQGQQLELTVRSSVLDAVELVGLDELQAISPETPAVFNLIADRPGRYPVVLTQAGRSAGMLHVIPAAG
jgi:hypothetical protein